jgi:hypothetical protein
VLAMRCGGESVVQGAGGSAGQGQSGGSGGKGAGGVGASGGVGATSMGGGETGGVGGGLAGTAGMPFGGTAGLGLAGYSQGGIPGDAFAHCTPRALQYGADCSFEDACEALECGAAWSLHREDGCPRTRCFSDMDCALEERCIAAPITGAYARGFSSGCVHCAYTEGVCSCICSMDLSHRAVCLSMQEIPPACPVAGLNCADLETGITSFQDYLDDGRFTGNVVVRLEECRNRFIAQREGQCLGQGGASGEGGSG